MFRAITQQLRRVRDIGASVAAIADTVAEVLDPRLNAHLEEGETLDGMGPFQRALLRWLRADHEELEGAEQEQRAAQRKLKKLQLSRDRQEQGLYGILIRIRTTFDDAFGTGLAEIFLGLGPRLANVEPLVLRRHALEAVEILSDPGFTPPPTLVEGLWESPLKYAEQIQEALDPLKATLDEIAAQQREIEKTVKAKTELLELTQTRLTWATRLFESLFHLADLGYHAERLRPPSGSRSPGEDSESPKYSESPEDSESPKDSEAPRDPESAEEPESAKESESSDDGASGRQQPPAAETDAAGASA